MKNFLVIALMMFITQLQAQIRIGKEEAYSTAIQFASQQGKQVKQTLKPCEEIKSKQSGQTNLFVFSIEPKGYVIVSAMNDVLAYSFESTISTFDELPYHIAYWLELYNDATDYLIEHPEQRKELTKSQTIVEPLLTSAWGQGCYHNACCPVDYSGPCYHVEAGCVAIAMAQIMYYHKYPLTGNGKMSYTCSPYGTLIANFGQTTYQWDEMSDTLHENNPAVAKLVSHCGIAVKMQYSSNGSGANSKDVSDAMHRYFFYTTSSFSKRDSFSDDEWQNIIKNDLDRQHPIYYSGRSILGGHAFVCDGYDNNGMFHFNFGWDGVADGYYTIDAPYGFSESQSIVHDIYPMDSIPIHSDNHGIIYVAPDGTGDGSSWAQATAELQLALFKARLDCSSIWVKEGTYYGNSLEDYAFNPLLSCKLYGGFIGDEPFDYDLSQRDFDNHPSILDGNHTQGVIHTFASNSNDSILIDGFTIQNGTTTQGSGILIESNARIRNCKFCHNDSHLYGGGLSQGPLSASRKVIVEDCEFFENESRYGGAVIDHGNTSFFRCHFHDNHARKDGGGIYCFTYGSLSRFINCTISNNTAKKGGGIAITKKQGPSFWSCLINNNTAEIGGGCYFEEKGSLYNCTVVKNEGTVAYGGIFSDTQADIRNCIVWGNTSPDGDIQIGPLQTYTYCAVQDERSASETNFSAMAENDGDTPSFYIRFNNAEVAAGNTGHGGLWFPCKKKYAMVSPSIFSVNFSMKRGTIPPPSIVKPTSLT